MRGKLLIFGLLALGLAGCGQPPVASVIDAPELQAHLDTLDRAAPHRAGGAGDKASRDLAIETLTAAGYDVSVQTVPIRQWIHERAILDVDGQPLEGFPLWWPPEGEPDRRAKGRLSPAAKAVAGEIALLSVPPQVEPGLKKKTRRQLQNALDRDVAGVILLTETPSGEAFAFNTRSPRPGYFDVPVLILGSAHEAALATAMAEGVPVTLTLDGHYEDLETWNIIGRMDRSGERTVAVSTTRTGWYTSLAERGPGIALFLELSKWAATTGDADLLFVATGGHELGHIGMDHFLESAAAPAPDATALWVHLGASIAAYQEAASPHQNTDSRWIIYSADRMWRVRRLFGDMGYHQSPGFLSTFGEAADIKKAGYKSFIAFAGAHDRFHLPGDRQDTTSGEIVKPAGDAVVALMRPAL